MNADSPLQQDKRLTIIFRVESGCLGPEGKDKIEEFCGLAQKEIEVLEADFIHWLIVPRSDKAQSEMQYKVAAKNLTRDKAEKYLNIFEINIDDIEGQLLEKITYLIEHYLGR